MQITFTINTEFIIMALYENIRINFDSEPNAYEWYDKFKPNKTSVEKMIRSGLFYQGERWMSNYTEAEEDRDGTPIDKAKWAMAEEKAKELYPLWFQNYHKKSLRFIQD